MSLHTDLPIYRTGVDLVKLAFAVQQQMPRTFKRTLGEKITVHCTDMLDLMAMANASRGAERAAYIHTLLQRQHATSRVAAACQLGGNQAAVAPDAQGGRISGCSMAM